MLTHLLILQHLDCGGTFEHRGRDLLRLRLVIVDLLFLLDQIELAHEGLQGLFVEAAVGSF